MATATITRESVLAMEAGEEMDGLIAERLMGWHWEEMPENILALLRQYDPEIPPSKRLRPPDCGYWGPSEPLGTYSTDIAAAWLVVEKMLPTHCLGLSVEREGVSIGGNPTGGVEAVFGYSEVEENHVTAPTAPLAICKAALVALLWGEANPHLKDCAMFPC